MSVNNDPKEVNNNPINNPESSADKNSSADIRYVAGLLQGFSADPVIGSSANSTSKGSPEAIRQTAKDFIGVTEKVRGQLNDLEEEERVSAGNFMKRAFDALSSMQSSLTDVYMSDGKLSQNALDILNNIMKQQKEVLKVAQDRISQFTGKDDGGKMTEASNEYNRLSTLWKNYYNEAQSNLNIPQDSASRSSTNMSNYQQFLSQLMGIMTTLSQALARG